MVFRPILTSQSIERAPDHVWGIPVHLFIIPDRLNSSNLEYSSSGCLDHPNYDFFWKIDIKSDGGEYKWSFLRVIFNFVLSLTINHEDLFITSLWVEISIFKVDPIFIPPHSITFSGPLPVYFTNTHSHERSLGEVNLIPQDFTHIVKYKYSNKYVKDV